MTQKIVQTAEHQLSVARARNVQLQAENHELRLALSRLAPQAEAQPAVKKHTLALQKHIPTSEHDSSPTYSEIGVPSFARSTKASRLRESRSPTSDAESFRTVEGVPSSDSSNNTANEPKPVTVGGKSYFYHNGGLTIRNFGYLVSTKSTINRFGDNEQLREARSRVRRPTFAKPEPWTLSCYANSKAGGEECSQPAEPAPIISQAEFDDRIVRKEIEIRTRLHQDSWVSEPANNVIIDHDELFDILSRAEKLAKRCLWRWLRANHPGRCEFPGLHYLSDMDLSRDRVTRLPFGNAGFYDYRWTKSYEVEGVIEDLVGLRNRVHHFHGRGYNMAIVDEHLYDVQHLAVLLYDEETATRTMSLRARLRQTAEEAAAEIEAVRYLTALPFAGDYPWRHHHIELLDRVLWRIRDPYDYDLTGLRRHYSPAAIAAAQEYGERKNYMSWDCKPDVEESLANVQRLAEGGYGGEIQTPSPKSQRGRVSCQLATSRWRSVSANGPRRLWSRGEKDDTRSPTRRGSFCLGGAAVDRSQL